MAKLLQASRIPARHQKLIKVEIDEGEGDSLFMFSPNQVELQQHGLVMVDSVMDVEEGHCANLLIEIPDSFWPRKTKEGGTVMIDPPTTDEPTDTVTNAPAERAMPKKSPKKAATKATPTPRELPKNNPWHGRLRGRKHAGTPVGEEGDM